MALVLILSLGVWCFLRLWGTFVGQGDILSDKGTFCWTKGHFVGQGDIMLYKGRSLSDKGTFSLKSLFGLLWAGEGMWRH